MTDDIAPLVAQVQRERRAVLVDAYERHFREGHAWLRWPSMPRDGILAHRLVMEGSAEGDTYERRMGNARFRLTPAGIAEVERMCAAREDDAALVEDVAAWLRGLDPSALTDDRATEVARKVVAMVRGDGA
ncbi:MAG: hypothetical protein KGK07_14485 [Chloroflexota bacterium]|nr:hypothetical protein [Chloroflexota bacterium]